MALFTSKADRKLPLTTQFCQLEILPTEEQEEEEQEEFVSPELDRFLFLYGNSFSDQSYSEEGVWSSSYEIEERDDCPNEGWNDAMFLKQEVLKTFLTIYITKNFEGLNKIDENDEPFIEKFNRLLLGFQSNQYLEYTEKSYLKLGRSSDQNSENCLSYYELLTDIADELIDTLKKKREARFCAECDSPFIVIKKDQKFCSTRCRQRQGQRIRMRRLFER